MKQLIGPLGYWKLPLVNKLLSKREETPKIFYSIKDHEILMGNPNYISNLEIEFTGDSEPFILKAVYDCDIQMKWYDQNGQLIFSPIYDLNDGQQLSLSLSTIEYLKNNGYTLIWEQITPVGRRNLM